ncbi:c-type cytochrome [Blastopirellula sp. JC732]|uniref:C-type cytochrome n=1 Tax=Blastopirellula sediminis TaxID=2894196 RepID=A0A9X1SIQ0_9BACT|nr:c-type cytochrome [Blastopirellula sediminis]MCC9608934.1 c-type cytochrome [Blastopirellula sediminis]MCC9628289.1 c-type cytochrome [Blastopirellula sediminis]
MNRRYFAVLVLLLFGATTVTNAAESILEVPEGYTVEVAAPSSLIAHPLMADFDEQGRLYVAANSGQNLPRAELEKELPNFVQRLEDVDKDGVFDKVTMFADKMTFPQGCLWHKGSLYVASSGAIWKLTDTDDDGVADERVKLVGDFGYTGNAADVHGPFLGPEGRLYWCEGRHGHEIKDAAGNLISKGKAARIFSSNFDGSDVQTYCAGGMDNPVEIVFTPAGEMLGTVNLMYSQPRGDCLVHWQKGGVYPRTDFAEGLESEFIRTGDLLPEVLNFGHVAVSGLCLDKANPNVVFVTQFNTNRIVRVELKPSGSTFAVANQSDFAVSPSHDFHPTDVLQDADGSLLVIDTGGWFRIGCPKSELAKPDIRGAIYRIRKTKSSPADATNDDPVLATQQKIWSLRQTETAESLAQIAPYLRDENSLIRQTAAQSLLDWPRSSEVLPFAPWLYRQLSVGQPSERRVAATVLGTFVKEQPSTILPLLEGLARKDNDAGTRHALILGLIQSGDRQQLSTSVLDPRESVSSAAAIALEQLRRPQVDLASQNWLEIPAASMGKPLTEEERSSLLARVENLAAGDAERGKFVFASAKIACNKCHQVAGEGGQVGPDLTTIGRSRERRDLLESILYPNATFARGFAPYVVLTDEGKLYSGIILGENTKELHLGVDKENNVRIPNEAIEEIRASDVSIMPPDFHKALSDQELADLIAYLESRK